MGRPIKKEFIGAATNNAPTKLIISQAFIPGASAVSNNVTILKQKGTGAYIVTDGTNTGLVRLVEAGTTLAEGQAILNVTINLTETETTEYTPASITLNAAGTGYAVNDSLTIPNAGTYVVNTVSEAVVGGEITTGTATVSTTKVSTDPSGTSLASTGGTGTGATFDATSNSVNEFTISGVTLKAGGTGYAVNDTLTFGSFKGTANVEAVSSAVVGGTILTGTPTLSTTQYTVNNAGDSVAVTGGTGTGATFKVTTTSSTTYLPKAIELNAAGTGYAVNDTVTITNAGVITITAIGTDGAISTYTTALSGTAKDADMAGTGVTQQSTTGSGTGATFNITSTATTIYPIASATLVDGGSGYVAGDDINVGGGVATYKVSTVSTAVAGGTVTQINNIVYTSDALTTDPTNANEATTGGKGTGATVSVTADDVKSYTPATLTLDNGGSGYKVGDKLTIANNGTYTVTAVSSAVTGGAILTGTATVSTTPSTTDMAGTGVAATGGKGTGATFNITSTATTNDTDTTKVESARVVYDRTVSTFEGGNYPWTLETNNEAGRANLPTASN